MALMRNVVRATRSQFLEGNLCRTSISIRARTISTDNANVYEQTKIKVQEQKGRPWVLFASPPEVSLACAVSADLQMHRGIAREFKKTYESIDKLKEQNKTTGDVAILNRNDSSFIYYLVTRDQWWGMGTSESIYSSLSAMKDHCIEHGVTKLAVPRLGSGEDAIGWPAVKDIIEDVFHDTGISITAYTAR